MKKVLSIGLVAALAISLVACGAETADSVESTESVVESVSESVEEATTSVEESTESVATDDAAATVMTYADFVAADVDTEVTVEAYVQNVAYSAEYGNASIFLANEDGAYYLYRATCDDTLAASLTEGVKVLVTGYKSEWSGEVEITDAVITVEDGNYVAEAKDVTDMLGDDTLAESINQLVAVNGATVVAANDEGAAFLYNWDGSGAEGSNCDLYFNVEVNGNTYNFTVESDENAEGSDVYTAVTSLNVGDVIDLDGFLYWYEGAQLHVQNVTVK